MPLTALLEEHEVLDATLDDLGCAIGWEAVYRARPRAPLSCTACRMPMHAKVSGRGGRFFAHDRRLPGCAAAGESEEHRSMKRALAAAAREAGCRAELEVSAGHGGWRADVLVTVPGRGPTVFEAQVSSAPLDEVLARTRRYGDDGVTAVWFTHRAARWLHQVPAARLFPPSGPDRLWTRVHPLVHGFSVVACGEVCDPQPSWHGPVHANWFIRHEELLLTRFVADVLHGRLIPHTVATEQGPYYDGWAAPQDVAAAAAHARAQSDVGEQ